MKKPLIVYYDIQDFQKSSLNYLMRHIDLIVLKDPTDSAAHELSKVNALFAPMGFIYDNARLEKYPNLCAIGTPTTGILHIDEAYAKAKNIKICSLRDQQKFLKTITPTAELAWGMIICLVRHIPQAFASVCDGNWDGKYFGKKTPRMFSEMSLGIVGLGRLGSLVARYGKAFGMNVHYYDPYVQNDNYMRCLSLQELAEKSDVVSIHVHSTPETEKFIGYEFFHSMPEGSFFINTARGNILDENALLEALEQGHLGGAALDTLTGEHLPGFSDTLADHPLMRYANGNDNLLLTPHYGGCTKDAWEMTERHIIDMMLDELKQRGLT